MSAVPLAERVVEVIADDGDGARPRYRYGSGCIVRGRTVLTAAHVVSGAANVMVRDPDKRLYQAIVEPRFVGDATGSGPDLALIQIDSPDVDLPPIGLAAVDRDSAAAEPVERCQAVGYPWFAQIESPTATRDTVGMVGVIPVLSKLSSGMLSVLVPYPPRELPPADVALTESPWSGMSGAPVVADGNLIGVVTEHAPREGSSSITAVPLTALTFDPAHPRWGPGVSDPQVWWAQLGVTGTDALLRMPVKPSRPEPAYRATLREFGQTLHSRMPKLLGRETEIADIAAFATGPPGYRWLVGGAFAGKSALTYEAITAGLPSEVDVVSYFLSRRASDADSSRFLAAVVPQLAYLCEVEPPTADRDQFNVLWQRAAARAAVTERNLVLVVDGLDEDRYPMHSSSVASLLPTLVEGRSHVVVTSRPRPELPDDLPDGHPLSLARPVVVDPFQGSLELAARAEKEIRDLIRGPGQALAVTVLGLLTAAAGPLSVSDLAGLSADVAPPSAAHRAEVRRLITEDAARSLEPVGSGELVGYQFAHGSLLEYARSNPALSDSEYQRRIRSWAAFWRDLGWPTTTQADTTTPRYLLDGYPEMLARDGDALASLIGDVGWVEAAIRRCGVERVLAVLHSAETDGSTASAISGMLAVVGGQAQTLVLARSLDEPGFVLRHLCLQALELGEDRVVDAARRRMLARADPGPVPLWTTRKATHALSTELGRQLERVLAVKVFPDGRVVCGGWSGLQVWDPLAIDGGVVFSAFHGSLMAVGLLHDGRIVTGDRQGRLLLWDLSTPGADPVELGECEQTRQALDVRGDGTVLIAGRGGTVRLWDPQAGGPAVKVGRYGQRVTAVAGSADGRAFVAVDGGRILMANPAEPHLDPVELGHHRGRVHALECLPDGRVVSGGQGGMRVWDPGEPGAPVESGRPKQESAVGGIAVLGVDRVVTGDYDCHVRIWNLASPSSSAFELGSHDGPISAVAVLPDGRIVSGGGDGRVRVWDTGVLSDEAGDTRIEDAWSDAVALLPDGRAVTAGRRGHVAVWNPATVSGEPVELGRRLLIRALLPLPDGRLASDGSDWRPLLWDPDRPSSRPVQLGPATDEIDEDEEIEDSCSLVALPDGRVVSSGGRRLRLWDPHHPSGDMVTFVSDPLEEEPNGHPHPLAVLSDGQVVSAHDDGRVLLWDPATPSHGARQLGRLDNGFLALAALPDGRLISADMAGKLLIWNPQTPGAGIVELADTGEGGVVALAGLADGRVISGGPGDVRVWDCSTLQETARIVFAFSAFAVTSASLPEQRMITAHQGYGITVWSLPNPGVAPSG